MNQPCNDLATCPECTPCPPVPLFQRLRSVPVVKHALTAALQDPQCGIKQEKLDYYIHCVLKTEIIWQQSEVFDSDEDTEHAEKLVLRT